jgi:TRAP-type mannitol/chloroaromatic compound transport system permease small subunit
MADQNKNIPRFCLMIDRFIRTTGKIICWVNSLLVVNILVQVILRYVLGEGQIWLEELQWHFYGIIIMLGIGYGITVDAHIRLDIFHRKYSTKTKKYIEFFGTLFLVFPLIIVLFMHGVDFVQSAWRVHETSPHPLGLPWRWLIKSVIPISMLFILLASLSCLVNAAAVILNISWSKRD